MTLAFFTVTDAGVHGIIYQMVIPEQWFNTSLHICVHYLKCKLLHLGLVTFAEHS